MKRHTKLWLTAATILTLVTGMAGAGWAASATPEPAQGIKASVAAQATAAAQVSNGGPQEGIKVHGHWIIEVRNPDGSVVERRDFENALRIEGASMLADFLGRRNSVGGWEIRMGNPTDPDPLPLSLSIVESTYPFTAQTIFKTLTVDVPSSGANALKLVLGGTATAYKNGTISNVLTAVVKLPNSEPPSASYPASTVPLTGTILGTPVPLTTGQIVQVTVIISFS